MPRPDVLLIEGDELGHAMMYRYAANGDFAGDSWYESVAMAQESAISEYGNGIVGSWNVVPTSEPDAHEYAIRFACQQSRA
jgi:hypothetical protein